MTTADGWANALSGTVAGHAVQAGAVYGNIHFHGPADRPAHPTPRQLLSPPAHFTDRAAELAQIDGIVAAASGSERPPLVVLSGPGGVGKTALALRWAHRVHDRFADGQLYIDLAGFSDAGAVDPGEALGQFLRALGVAPQQVPVALKEQAALYRSLTSRLSLLVLLDNAYSSAQARVLVPASPASVVLVTSRSRLTGLVGAGARLVEVRPLAETPAVSLLASTVGDARVASEPDGAATLVRLCGGLPIAICLAAARLAARPRWSVGRVVSELVDEHGRLAALSGPSTGDDLSVQASFDLSYQLLPGGAATLYRRVGLHPGREFGPAVGAAALDRPPAETDRLFGELVEANLVEEIREDRYRLHDLLRLHARQRTSTDDTEQDRDDAQRRMLEWYLAAARVADRLITPYRKRLPYEFVSSPDGLPGLAGWDEALGWLDDERANLVAAGRAGLERGWFPLAWQLADVMWPLLLHRKHYRDRVGIDELGLEAARRWGDTAAEATMLKRLGRVSSTLGRYDDAERHLRAAMTKWAEVGDGHGVGDAQEGLGLMYVDLGRMDDAAAEFERVLARYRELGVNRRIGLASINLAMVLPRLGRAADALRHIEEARCILDTLADVDPYNGARALVVQAAVRCAMGELDAATALAVTGLERMRALGSRYGEAEADEVLADVELRRGNLASGRTHFDLAERAFAALRSPREADLRARLGPSFYPQDPAR